MISRFTNLFKKTDLDEQRAFQSRVLAILSDLYPERSFRRADDPLVVEIGEQKLGLTSLRANFLRGSQSDVELRELISDHFGKVFFGLKLVDREDLTWEAAQSRLMPQLMPQEFLEKIPLISYPFGDGVEFGFVLDTEQAYSYLVVKDVERWNVDKEQIRKVALANLSNRSQGIEIAAFPGDNAFIVINTMDGFDAARIVSPDLRSFLGETVGKSFYFGIPNRDFLVCWSKNGDAEFQGQMRTQISKDFDEQPYPLSRNAFEVTEEDEIILVQAGDEDPRATAAVNN